MIDQFDPVGYAEGVIHNFVSGLVNFLSNYRTSIIIGIVLLAAAAMFFVASHYLSHLIEDDEGDDPGPRSW